MSATAPISAVYHDLDRFKMGKPPPFRVQRSKHARREPFGCLARPCETGYGMPADVTRLEREEQED
jgi:hypothetical protein